MAASAFEASDNGNRDDSPPGRGDATIDYVMRSHSGRAASILEHLRSFFRPRRGSNQWYCSVEIAQAAVLDTEERGPCQGGCG